jgi:hypothetical protein
LETVDFDTPATAATSKIVGAFPWRRRLGCGAMSRGIDVIEPSLAWNAPTRAAIRERRRRRRC